MKNLKMQIVLWLFIATCSTAFAQSKQKDSSREKATEQFDKGATYELGSGKKSKKKKSKHSLAGDFDKKVEEYEQRMEDNAKKYKKMAKEMKKPQYSDPTYFGHKKKPKKRPPGKKKFCKECGMYH